MQRPSPCISFKLLTSDYPADMLLLPKGQIILKLFISVCFPTEMLLYRDMIISACRDYLFNCLVKMPVKNESTKGSLAHISKNVLEQTRHNLIFHTQDWMHFPVLGTKGTWYYSSRSSRSITIYAIVSQPFEISVSPLIHMFRLSFIFFQCIFSSAGFYV